MEVRLVQSLIEFNWNLLFSGLTFLALFLVLKHFFFDKVHNFMIQRQEAVEKQLKEADEANKEADARLKEYEDVVGKAEDKSREIIKEARSTANVRADDIVGQAKIQAEEILARAEKQAQLEKVKAMSEMKEEIAQIAVMAAGQIVEKELEQSGQDEIINKIIKEAGAGKWQN